MIDANSNPKPTGDAASRMPTVGRSPRFEELDSLRGLAAVSVLLYHVFAMFLISGVGRESHYYDLAQASQRYPVRILWDGFAAVSLFFVLSGFVLALPSIAGRAQPYSTYLIRRICRIYPPYLVAVVVAVILRLGLATGSPERLPEHLRELWSEPLSGPILGHHLLLVTSSAQAINPVTWSLTYEMRISMLFPLLMVFVNRWNFWLVLIGFWVATTLGLWRVPGPYVEGVPRDEVLLTARVIFAFLVGAVIAKHREELVHRFARLPWPVTGMLLIGGMGLYTYGEWISKGFRRFLGMDFEMIRWTCAAVGAGVLVVAAMGLRRVAGWLRTGPLVYLGRISYSLYLYHMVILLTLFHAAGGRVAPVWLLLATVPLSFLAADLGYRLVEVPSMMLGRWLTARRTV